MSSVLHPTGPEGPQTYWLRRIGVVVAALVVVLVVAWAWPNGGDGDDATPAADSSTVTTPAAPSSSTTPASTASATPTATGTTPAPSSTGTSTTTASASSTPSSSTSASPSKTSPSKTAPSKTPASKQVRECRADDVHVTLTGPRQATIAKKTTLKLSVINGGDDTCRLSLDAKTFELKIYSGTDRIWSTHDCDTWMKPIEHRALKSQQEVDWSQAWPAKRSHSGCKLADNLRPGTYVATAQLTLSGAKAAPVQLVMSLHR